MGHFPCAVTPWFTYKVKLVWNPPLLLLCYKENTVLTPVSPGCCNIFSSYNQVRRTSFRAPSHHLPSLTDWGLLLQQGQSLTSVALDHHGGSTCLGSQLRMLSSGLPESIPSSFQLETWSEVTSGATFRKEAGVVCGCRTPHQEPFSQQLWRRVWNIFKAGSMLSMFWSFDH